MVMTAFDEEYSAGTAISLGAREFIKKPFSPEEFAIRLSKMIGDSEIMKEVKSRKGTDKDTQQIVNVEPSGRKKSETRADEEIERLVDDLLTPSKKN